MQNERDRLIQDRATEVARLTVERARVGREAQAAIAEIEKMEEPRKRLESLNIEGSQLAARHGDGERIFREQITRLAPPCLSAAIKKVDSLKDVLGTDRCHTASVALGRLLTKPGDVSADVESILGDLFGDVSNEVCGKQARQLLAS